MELVAHVCLVPGSFRTQGGLGGTVVRRLAHDPRVVCSIPALATFEDSMEYKWVPGP